MGDFYISSHWFDGSWFKIKNLRKWKWWNLKIIWTMFNLFYRQMCSIKSYNSSSCVAFFKSVVASPSNWLREPLSDHALDSCKNDWEKLIVTHRLIEKSTSLLWHSNYFWATVKGSSQKRANRKFVHKSFFPKSQNVDDDRRYQGIQKRARLLCHARSREDS